MTDPGLPLTTGEGNTARPWQCEGCDWLNTGSARECDGCGEPKSTALLSRSGALADLSEARAEVARLREQLDAARREVDSQMQSKLDAQVTLKAVSEALDLRFDELGDGWREAAPKILARIETIVNEADRAFRERDAARAALGVEGPAR